MHALRALFVLCLAVAPATAQQYATYGDHVVLPTFGPDGQDHATLAVNQYGDVYVAWHSGLLNGTHNVEGMALPWTGGSQWLYDPLNYHMLLGDPALALIGLDTCTKPDVAALEDGSFVVAWARTDEVLRTTAYLEAARIEVRDAAGQLLASPIVTLAQPGQGVVVDNTANAGQAVLMVDLVALGDREVAAIYGHEAVYGVGTSGSEYREYDLRAMRMDWALPTTAAGFLDGPHTLRQGIAMDNRASRPYQGGVLLPDAVRDDSGNLVVAWESYWVDGHGGVSGNDGGKIEVARFAPFTAVNPTQELDAVLFPNTTADAYRRPNLSTSREDTVDTVTLTWMEDRDSQLSADRSLFHEIDYGAGFPADSARYWLPPTNLSEDQHPVPLLAPGKSLCVATRTTPGLQRRMLASWDQGHMMLLVPTPISFPWRPAVARHPGGPGSPGTTDQVVFLTYEGANNLNPSDFRVRLMLRKL